MTSDRKFSPDEIVSRLLEILDDDFNGSLAYLAGILEAEREAQSAKFDGHSGYALEVLREELDKWHGR